MARNVGDVARFLPAVEQAFRLVEGDEAAVRLVEIAVVVDHPAVGHPCELRRERKPLPCQRRAEAALPRGEEALAGQHLVLVAEFGGQLALLGVPQGVAVGGIDAGEAVDVEFAHGVSHDQLGVGTGHFVLRDAVIEFGDLVLVVGYVGVHAPQEVLACDDGTRQAQLDAAVDHAAYVAPVAAVAFVGIGFGNLHQHVGRLLVVEFDVQIEPVPEAQMQGHVGRPELLPAQLLVARLGGGDAGVAEIVLAAGHQREVFVVGNLRVARRTGADGDLRQRQPAAGVLHEFLVAQVPHEAHRPEAGPAVRGAEARGAVGTQREVGVVTVRIAVLGASEERQVGVVVVGGVAPAGGARTRRDVHQFVVVLVLGLQGEGLVPVVESLLPREEGEHVLVVDVEPVGDRVGDRKAHSVGGVALYGTRTEVGGVARIGDAAARRVRIIDAELRAERKPFDRGRLGEDRGYDLVLLVVYGVVLEPFERVLPLALPRAVVHRRQRTVGAVRVPVGKHEACGRNRRGQGVFPVVGLLDGLVVHHRVGTEFEPLGGPLLDVGADRVAFERRTHGRTVLTVVAARNVVVGLFAGS